MNGAAFIEDMTNLVRHRGPDDEGYHLIASGSATAYHGAESNPESRSGSPIQQADFSSVTLAMGHRRLSILDLSNAGHQPQP